MYQPLFVQVYRQMGSDLPIGVWAEVVGRNLPMFKSDNQIYNPATVRVKMTKNVTDPEGTVQLDVALSDADWYGKLTSAIGKMMGCRTPIDLVDVTGKSIHGSSYAALNSAGDLDVVDRRTRQPVYVGKIVPPPREMASDKHVDIGEWFSGLRTKLCDVITDKLQGCDMVTLQTAVAQGGPVQRAIEQTITASQPDWSKFLQTYARDDDARALSPVAVAKQLSRSVLTEVRKCLRANKKRINRFYAYKQGSGEKLWDDKVASNVTRPVYQSDLEMFDDLVDDALSKSALAQKVYWTVHAGTNVASSAKRTKSRPVLRDTGEHPLDWYYHQHHYKRFGKLPGHVVQSFNKNRGVNKRAPYPGDSIKAIAAFHLFSGRHQLPNERPGLIPLEESAHYERPISLGAEMPRLVPIAGCAHPKLIPLEDGGEMPRLVPIAGCAHPKLIPLEDGEMPRLVRKAGLIQENVGHALVSCETTEDAWLSALPI